MNDQEVLAVMTRVLRDVLDDPSITLDMQTVRADVPDWDSFKYVTFIVAAEIELGVRFGVADVESFVTMGDIVAKVRSLLG